MTAIMNLFHPLFRVACALLIGAMMVACSTLPPGHDYPRIDSRALAHPEHTSLGEMVELAAGQNPGKSGFRLLSFGVDAYLTRMQMIHAAERSLDLQYSIFRGDDTGRLMTQAALRAADRGVRVRILMDDGERITGDDQISPLTAHRSIEIRFYNPFAYRGTSHFLRGIEYIFNQSRLDYRMHNKLMVVDNAVALIGGRNIGDQYFQIDADEQYADNDVFVVGPIVKGLSASFDEFWNHPLSIPKEALSASKSSRRALTEHRQLTIDEPPQADADGTDLIGRVNSGEPFAGMISGRLPLVWAPAKIISDSPDKKSVTDGSMVGRLMHRPVANATLDAQSEVLMITPYLIPGDEGLELFRDLRRRGVRVRILTNSLTSSTIVLAHSGYIGYRVPLLEEGVELFEIRAELGNTRGSGQTAAMSRHGTYSLHAKVFVFDRQRIFVGSMNFDQRSMHLNTEIGLLIDSPELARELARRFEAMVQPANAYQVLLQPGNSENGQHLIWRTLEDDRMVDLLEEPARSTEQTSLVRILSLLPLDSKL